MADAERPGAQQWVPMTDAVADLRAAAPACRGCELWEPATQVVFSAGNPDARVVLVGEQPGDVEDQHGIPFIGPAGRLLQQAIDEAGLARSEVYVTNAVKHFRFTPRGKRRIHQTPDLAHIVACQPWVEAELAAVQPELIVALGATAARAVIGPDVRVTRDRGRLIVRDTTAGPRRFVPTIHPSAVLRVPDADRPAAYQALVDDLRTVVGVLG